MSGGVALLTDLDEVVDENLLACSNYAVLCYSGIDNDVEVSGGLWISVEVVNANQ